MRVFSSRRFKHDKLLGQVVCNFAWDPRIGATSLSTYGHRVLCQAPLRPCEDGEALGILEFATARLVEHGSGHSWDPPLDEPLPPRELQIDVAGPLYRVGHTSRDATQRAAAPLQVPTAQGPETSSGTILGDDLRTSEGGMPIGWVDPLGAVRDSKSILETANHNAEADVRRAFSSRTNPTAMLRPGLSETTRVVCVSYLPHQIVVALLPFFPATSCLSYAPWPILTVAHTFVLHGTLGVVLHRYHGPIPRQSVESKILARFGRLSSQPGAPIGAKLEYEHEKGVACTVATVVRAIPRRSSESIGCWVLQLAHSLEEVVVYPSDARVHPVGWSTWSTVRLDIPDRTLVSPRGWHHEFEWNRFVFPRSA
jgi:hypothetical protein